MPLPYSGVLVRGTYYSVQDCILLGLVRGKNGKFSNEETEVV